MQILINLIVYISVWYRKRAKILWSHQYIKSHGKKKADAILCTEIMSIFISQGFHNKWSQT